VAQDEAVKNPVFENKQQKPEFMEDRPL